MCACTLSPWGPIVVSTHRTEACRTCLLRTLPWHASRAKCQLIYVHFHVGLPELFPRSRQDSKETGLLYTAAVGRYCSDQAHEDKLCPPGGPGACRRQTLRQVPSSRIQEGSMETGESQQCAKPSLRGWGGFLKEMVAGPILKNQ